MFDSMTSRRRTAPLIGAVAILVGATLIAVMPTAASRAGAASPLVTYQASVTKSGALANAFASHASSPTSDGWAVALSSTQVFNVSHHQPTVDVTCHNQTGGSPCWPNQPTKIVSSGAFNFATSQGTGLYMDQASGHLFTFAVETDGITADNVAGVVCIDTSQPVAATGSQLFCGFTPLSAKGDASIGLGSFLTSPIMVGNHWYAFNTVPGVGASAGAGTENTLLCFDVTTLAACPTKSYAMPLRGTVTTASGLGMSGNDVFLPVQETVASASVSELTCFDTLTATGCAGSWPHSEGGLGGAPFPLLSPTGTPVGICNSISGNRCFDFTGTVVATPPGLSAAIGADGPDNGPALQMGTRIYLANYRQGDKVVCYDFATSSSCPRYPKVLTNLLFAYTVNADPFRPNCIWVNSDSGVGQIQNFDATTGGACQPSLVRFNASSFIDPSPICQPTAALGSTYQSIQITGPPRSSYTSGTVQFADARGVIVPGIPAQRLNGFGVANLSGLNFSADPSPQFVITLNGMAVPPTAVGMRLTWKAAYSPVCSSEGQSVSNTPGYWMSAADGGIFDYGNAGFFGSTGNLTLNKPIVGMATASNRVGYWLVASDGGIFAYGSSKFYGSTGNITLNKPVVGMAATPSGSGYWLVASDGGIFSYGNAQFYGSAGNLHLNRPIVGMASTSDGGGYWLVASDGGIFAYGDAKFYGSTGNITLNKPIVGIASNPNPIGGGYWMVASDGGIFNYGSSGFFGSAGNIHLNKPIVGMAPTFDGLGYWLAASDGGIFNYGDAGFGGSAGGLVLNKPIVAIGS